MHPELIEIPFLHQTIKSWGVMVVLGFLAALWLMRRIMRRIGEDPEWISNAALYSLIAGVIGARIFFVVHHYDLFRGRPMAVFAIWVGGVELLGGVLAALLVLCVYLIRQKRPLLLYLDVLAIGLMIGLGFGRIGCFLSGCCYGKCTEQAWGVRFPYNSIVYNSQIRPDPLRGRSQPHLDLPVDYFGLPSSDGSDWLPVKEEHKDMAYLKPFDRLTKEQQEEVLRGLYRARRVHPTQLYSSANAFFLAAVLYGLWRRIGRFRPGAVAGAMLMFYGAARFFLETLRDDNPFEYEGWWLLYKGGTISQNLGIYLVIFGFLLMGLCLWKSKPPAIPKHNGSHSAAKSAVKKPRQ